MPYRIPDFDDPRAFARDFGPAPCLEHNYVAAAGVAVSAIGAGVSAYSASKKTKAMAGQTASTTMPILPEKELHQLRNEINSKEPEHFLSPEQRAQQFASIRSLREQSLKSQQQAQLRRAHGDASSPLGQRLMSILGSSSEASGAKDMADLDIADLARGDAAKQARIQNLMRSMQLQSGQQSNGTNMPPQGAQPSMPWLGDLGGGLQSIGGAMVGSGGGAAAPAAAPEAESIGAANADMWDSAPSYGGTGIEEAMGSEGGSLLAAQGPAGEEGSLDPALLTMMSKGKRRRSSGGQGVEGN